MTPFIFLCGWPDMTVLFKCIYGSRLYGTHTKKSDYDYKAIYLPSKDDILLGRTVDAKFTTDADGNDEERWTFHKFINLLSKNEHNSLNILYADTNKKAVIEMSDFWRDNIVSQKDALISSNVKASLGFMRHQINRYVVRGDRLNDIQNAVDVLSAICDDTSSQKMLPYRTEIESAICEGREFSTTVTLEDGVDYLEVCGKKVPFGSSVKEALSVYQNRLNEYGERAKIAANLSGVDWKGVSHCLRIGEETVSLLKGEGIKYPLKNASYIRKVKLGQRPKEEVFDKIEKMFADCEDAQKKSSIRRKSDVDKLQELVKKAHLGIIEGTIK